MSWPTSLTLRPITTWPTTRTADRDRRASPFRARLSDTLDLLDRELHQLRARDRVMEIAIAPGDVNWRQDGKPRAHARADHPGVVLVFTTPLVPGRELRYATDRFNGWHDNLRAIVLGLEALRKVERYGIANRGEQYAGWAQLAAGGPSADHGRELIRQHGSVAAALKATHPDHGGDPADLADVQAARHGS